ncbi:MAG: hypothetical protein ACQKBY_09890 [Verrucomicrobiales bacterium]
MLMPICGVFGMLAIMGSVWLDFRKDWNLARDFRADSKVYFFKKYQPDQSDLEDSFFNSYTYYYSFEKDGEQDYFGVYDLIDLPRDGRVRIGRDPSPPVERDVRLSARLDHTPERTIVVPVHGDDDVASVFEGMWEKSLAKTLTRNLLASLGGLVVMVCGVVLHKIIFREHKRSRRYR